MISIIFRLVVGSAFILLGRWVYRNPKRVYASWFYVDPEPPPLARIVARVWSVGLIFLGSYALLTIIAEPIAQGRIAMVAAIGVAILAALSTWYLRPRLAQPSGPAASPQPLFRALNAKGKWFLGIMLVSTAAATIAIIVFIQLHR